MPKLEQSLVKENWEAAKTKYEKSENKNMEIKLQWLKKKKIVK